ncbi:hypothetical protein KC316_g1802 [Hortaea werneckii]|nr:hypothetical protein KC324_g8933 [Hortaea werneckii]KAI7593334.1 hypothetical protein KC316_g1802 [Hortaea werneckii]
MTEPQPNMIELGAKLKNSAVVVDEGGYTRHQNARWPLVVKQQQPVYQGAQWTTTQTDQERGEIDIVARNCAINANRDRRLREIHLGVGWDDLRIVAAFGSSCHAANGV